MYDVLLLALILALALVGLLFIFTLFQMGRLPTNSPSKFLKHKNQVVAKKRVVLIGDSITHGRIGTNYVEMLSQWDKDCNFEFINAGINGDLVWNVCQRLDEIIECEPDIVTILIGSNDANASISPETQERYAKKKKLPTLPTHDWFQTVFSELLTYLIQRTDSRIAVLSLPTISEDFDFVGFKRSCDYSETIKNIATEMNIDYLPLNEKMVENCQSVPADEKYSPRVYETDMIKATMRYYLLRQGWDSISEMKGLSYHIDYLHMNTQGANLIAELIQQFLEKFLQSGD